MVCLSVLVRILMSTHNIYFHDKIRIFSQNIPKNLFSLAIGRMSLELENDFESYTVNEQSVFESLRC